MIEFNTFTLSNGLRVVHHYEPSTAMVAVDVLYDTGSRDESRELTGVAHLFEHLMFGGSVNIPDFDSEMESAGGVNNAWTSNDFTNFYDVVPAQNIETALRLESDRMLGLAFSEDALRVQRAVVIEEFKQQCLNRPYGDAMHHLRAMLYAPGYPYSWPVIGLSPDHIAKATNEDIRRIFYAHYAPNNAVLAVAGNISFERTCELVEKWFGDLPKRDIPPRHMPSPGFPSRNVRKTVKGNVPQTSIIIAYPMDGYGTLDYRTADVITDLLATGTSSRFYRNLILGSGGLFAEAEASIMGCEHEGFLMLNCRVTDENDEAVARAERMMLDEALRLTAKGEVSEYELERTLRRFETSFTLSNMGYVAKAQALSAAIIHGEDINETIALQRKVSLDDINRVARKTFSSPSATLIYRPR